VVGAAIAQRDLGAQEARSLTLAGAVLATLALVTLFWPYVLALPLSLLGGWLGISLLARARRIRREAGAGAPPRAGPPVG
jgi:cardiolipin synthase